MLSDKEQKKRFKTIASEQPEAYYPVRVLRGAGFIRKQCMQCGTFFWTTDAGREVCGDPACSDGFTFIGTTPAKKEYSYPGLWKAFARLFEKKGYTPIRRYPVVARWRDDTDFVQASIYDFQPHVVSGAVKPPANPLVVPQFSLRFNDVDNVGITGSHYTGFVMIGQHAFMPPERWDQEQYFADIKDWLNRGMGIPDDELTFHEDAWAGGGNFGPCMEFFSRGLELGNQVYMQFEQTPQGARELSLKVLDMGMGQERNAWFSTGRGVSYEAVFPSVLSWLRRETAVRLDEQLLSRFVQYGSMLNADEVEDLDAAWEHVAQRLALPVSQLKGVLLPQAAVYSIAEHTRSLLVAIADGALPSNVGGGHNLRMILRRALSLMDAYGWSFDFLKLFHLHARELREQYAELADSEVLTNVEEIVQVEVKRAREQRARARSILQRELARKREVTLDQLRVWYASHGITPELVRETAREFTIPLQLPPNVYQLLTTASEETVAEERQAKRFYSSLEGLKTHAGYFDDWRKTVFDATVIGIEDDAVVLDTTYFYPTSGGQLHDVGTLNGHTVKEVVKQGEAIVHIVPGHDFTVGMRVHGVIDWSRRLQHAQHHTATHLIAAAARRVLGRHVWQAGAEKRVDKARLDITHYAALTREQEKAIERLANEFVQADYPVEKFFMPRDEAEKQYGFVLYQGGIVPGATLRIVKVDDLDVEACGGTHVDHTAEVGRIRLLKSSRISDGVVRLEFVAGAAAERLEEEEESMIRQLTERLHVPEDALLPALEALFTWWKDARKARRKGKPVDPLVLQDLPSRKLPPGDLLDEACKIVHTQRDHLLRTVEKFLRDKDAWSEQNSP